MSSPVLKLVPRPAQAEGDLTFSAVFERHHRFVAALAARLCGRSSEVEDITQDVFFLCLRMLHTIPDLDSAKHWLRTVTVRVVRKRLRRKKWRAWFSSSDDVLLDLPYRGVGPEERAVLSGLYRTLQSLPVNERLAWSLRHVEGESLEAVAEACECSVSSAKRWINAAAERLAAEGHEHT